MAKKGQFRVQAMKLPKIAGLSHCPSTGGGVRDRREPRTLARGAETTKELRGNGESLIGNGGNDLATLENCFDLTLECRPVDLVNSSSCPFKPAVPGRQCLPVAQRIVKFLNVGSPKTAQASTTKPAQNARGTPITRTRSILEKFWCKRA
jgi:hypothetical protein